MKLMTKAIERKIPELYATEDVALEDKVCVVKFFMPTGSWTWYAVEGQKQEDGDWLFFGQVVNGYGEKELGFFVLSELQSIKGPLGLGVERDLNYTGIKLKV